MIVVNIKGGLGNQFFQYALGRSLSIVHKKELKLEAFSYEGNVADPQKGIRTFGLSNFNIKAQIATKEDLLPFKNYFRIDKIGKFYKLINLLKPLPYYKKKYLVEPKRLWWHFDKNILEAPIADPVYIKGFWQTEKYFIEIEKEIRQELMVKTPPDEINSKFLREIDESNSVAIHIRHGDNSNAVAAQHGVLPLNYYHQAMAEIVKKVDNPRFYIFSDDPDWVRENLKLAFDCVYVSHNNDENNFEDMRLMSQCKHHIIGNSTFSWWGAWLGKKAGQIVFAPKCYYVEQDISETDYYPKNWKLL